MRTSSTKINLISVKSGPYPTSLFPCFKWFNATVDDDQFKLKRGVRYRIIINSGSTLNSSSNISVRIMGDLGMLYIVYMTQRLYDII